MPHYQPVDLIYGETAQTVYVYPEEWPFGVPTSATCSVFKGDQSMDEDAEFSPTVTIDALSTTIATASGASQSNPRRLYLASAAGIDPGVSYLAENAVEQREVVTPTKVNTTSAWVELENELRYDYPASGCTLKGLRMSFPVNTTWVADANKLLLPHWPSYKAVWTYTQGGQGRRAYSYLRLVRQISKTGVSMRDLQRYWPDLPLEEPRNMRGQGEVGLIQASWDDCCRDLRGLGHEPTTFRDVDLLAGLHIKKCFHNLSLWRGVSPGAWSPDAFEVLTRKEYGEYLLNHFGAKTTPKKDEGTDGAASVVTRHSLWTTG